MSFAADVSKWVITAKKNPKKTRDGVLLKLFGSMIFDTPVDTGRARGNWQTNIGAANLSTDSADDKSGSGSSARARNTLGPSKMSDVIFFTNNLPYIQKLEMGSSQQAPAGMVRKNIVRFTNLINAEARRVNR